MRIAILSRQSGGGSTERLVTAFQSAGHKAETLNTSHLSLGLETGTLDVWKAGKVLSPFDGVIARIGHGITAHGVAVLRHFELQGIKTFPSSAALLRSREKLEALQHLAVAGVRVPPTAYVHRKKDLDTAIRRVGGAPLIVKVVRGTGGEGVVLAESNLAAQAIAAALISAGQPVLLQKFVAESKGRDQRIFVVGGRVVAAARRVAAGDEYRSNVHLGATAEAIEVEEEFRAIAVHATQVLGLSIAGVDVLEGADGPVVLEVNSSPGVVGFEDTTGVDVAGAIVDHVVAECG